MQLRKRGEKWYLRGTLSGQRVEVCTGLTDKKAAEAWARQWERDRADPEAATRRAARATTVAQALDLAAAHHEGEHRAGNITEATLSYYRRKLGVVLSTMGTAPDGSAALLCDVTASTVDRWRGGGGWLAPEWGSFERHETIALDLLVAHGMPRDCDDVAAWVAAESTAAKAAHAASQGTRNADVARLLWANVEAVEAAFALWSRARRVIERCGRAEERR